MPASRRRGRGPEARVLAARNGAISKTGCVSRGSEHQNERGCKRRDQGDVRVSSRFHVRVSSRFHVRAGSISTSRVGPGPGSPGIRCRSRTLFENEMGKCRVQAPRGAGR